MYRYTNRAAPRKNLEASAARAEPLRRDAPTLLSYGALAAFAFWLYAFGPALALLRAELHFSYGLIGVYSAVWSAGAATAGLCFAVLARRLRRGTLLWCSATAATAGAVLFAVTRTVAPTLAGATLLGFSGTIMLGCVQAILSDRHGERRDRVLAEANVGAAACGVLAPLLLGLLQDTPVGWRAAMGLPVLILAALYLRYRHQQLPEAPAAATAELGGKGRIRLSRSCWILAALVAVGVAVEFCVIYFGAELLTATGLRTAQATTAMSGFYLGILAGRVGGVWLIRRADRTVPLLWASLAVTTAGFLLFWLAGSPVPAIAGLFLCGLGIANLYPLSVALVLAAAPGNGDSANGTSQLLAGVLATAFPYLLGSLADDLGLRTAFTIELVLIGACAVLLLTGLRLAPRDGVRADLSLGGWHGARLTGQSLVVNNSVPRAVCSSERPLGRHPHPQGKFSSSVLVTAIITAFMGGGIATIVQSGWLLWLSVGVVLLGMPASWLVRVMRIAALVSARDLSVTESTGLLACCPRPRIAVTRWSPVLAAATGAGRCQ